MRHHRRIGLSTVAVLTVLLPLGGRPPMLAAQQMQHAAPSVPSSRLSIRTSNGKSLTFSREEFAALPHKSITVLNAHNNTNETYSGVPLADLLRKAGVPLGDQVKGPLFMTGVIAEGTDGYKVLYSLAEVDPALHTGDVIVADTLNGQNLGQDGAFRLVSSEDRRPARWVRNLSAISVMTVPAPSEVH